MKVFLILSLIFMITRAQNHTVGGVGQEMNPQEVDEVLKVLTENVKLMKDDKNQNVTLK